MLVAVNLVIILLTLAIAFVVGRKMIVKENGKIKLITATFTKLEVLGLLGAIFAQLVLTIGAMCI